MTAPDEQTLLPCPFCGNPAQTNRPPMRSTVYCTGCATKCEDATTWNTRAAMPDTKALGAQERKSRGYRVGHIAGYYAGLREAAHLMPRYHGVWSSTGVHIGVWGDGATAAKVLAEYPGGISRDLIDMNDILALIHKEPTP